MEGNGPDWAIKDLYQKAFDIVKSKKILWAIGAAISAGFSYSNSSSSTRDVFNDTSKKQAVNLYSQVLGAQTDAFSEHLKTIIGAIPWTFYLFLGLEVFVIVLIGYIIQLFYRAWAEGILIQYTLDTNDNNPVDLELASDKTKPKLKRLAWLYIIPWLIFFAATIITILVLMFLFTVLSDPLKILLFLLLLIAISAIVVSSITITLATIWGSRIIMTSEKSGKEAFFSALKIAKVKWGSMLLLGLANNILAFFIVAIPVAIVFAIVFALFITSNPLQNFTYILPVIFGIVFVAILGLFTLGGIINAFKSAVWTLAYNAIKGKYE